MRQFVLTDKHNFLPKGPRCPVKNNEKIVSETRVSRSRYQVRRAVYYYRYMIRGWEARPSQITPVFSGDSVVGNPCLTSRLAVPGSGQYDPMVSHVLWPLSLDSNGAKRLYTAVTILRSNDPRTILEFTADVFLIFLATAKKKIETSRLRAG